MIRKGFRIAHSVEKRFVSVGVGRKRSSVGSHFILVPGLCLHTRNTSDALLCSSKRQIYRLEISYCTTTMDTILQSTTVAAFDADQNIIYRFEVNPDDMSYSSMPSSIIPYENEMKPIDARALIMRMLQETHRMRQKIRFIRSRWTAVDLLPKWHGNQPDWRQAPQGGGRNRSSSTTDSDKVRFPKTWTFQNPSTGKPSLWGSPSGAFPHAVPHELDENHGLRFKKSHVRKQLERRRMGSLRAEF
jgi:hypothetical protein